MFDFMFLCFLSFRSNTSTPDHKQAPPVPPPPGSPAALQRTDSFSRATKPSVPRRQGSLRSTASISSAARDGPTRQASVGGEKPPRPPMPPRTYSRSGSNSPTSPRPGSASPPAGSPPPGSGRPPQSPRSAGQHSPPVRANTLPARAESMKVGGTKNQDMVRTGSLRTPKRPGAMPQGATLQRVSISAGDVYKL